MRGFWPISALIFFSALSGRAFAASSATEALSIPACPTEISQDLEVTGIARETGSSTVIIRSRLLKTEDVILEGDQVFSVGALRGITHHGAVLKLRGSEKLCKLAFGTGVGHLVSSVSRGESAAYGAVQPPKIKNQFVTTLSLTPSETGKGPSKVVALEAFCQNQRDLAEAIGLSPFHQIDKAESGDVGLRLTVIPEGSLLSQLEIPKDAVLTQVNGFNVQTRAQVVDALLGVSGQSITLRYHTNGSVTERSVFVH